MNDQRTSDLKIEIARKCLRNQISLLFANPMLEVIVRNPVFYQHDYVVIHLRIEKGSDNFFVISDPRSGDIVLVKGRDDIPKDFNRIFFADLLFDHLNKLHPNLNSDSLQSSIDCESLDIFSMLHENKDSKYVGITTVPSPSDAGRFFESIPELIALSNYLVENSAQFTYNNVTFFDLIRTIYKSFITSTKLGSPLASNNWANFEGVRILAYWPCRR